MPRVFLHVDVLSWLRGASRGEPRQRDKCLEHLRQLLATGETPFKITAEGPNKKWRRSQLLGNRFYLWWAPCGTLRQIVERVSNTTLDCELTDVYVRHISYHDATDRFFSPDARRPELWSDLTPELLAELRAPIRPERAGPRTGRGRVQPAGETGRAVDKRAARKRRKMARRARRRTFDMSTPDELVVPQPLTIPTPASPEPPAAVETAPLASAEQSPTVADEVIPAEVQQALLDLYDSKLSQGEAARRIGISQPTFSQWVSGRRGVGKRYWPKILNAAAALRPRSPPPAASKRRRAADKPAMPNEVQDALLDLLTTTVVARAEIARRVGVSPQTLAQWVNGGAVAEFYWPLLVIVANKVRAEQREVDEFARAITVLSERHGAENLPKLLGVRRETLADYHKYGVLPARAKVRKAIELAR